MVQAILYIILKLSSTSTRVLLKTLKEIEIKVLDQFSDFTCCCCNFLSKWSILLSFESPFSKFVNFVVRSLEKDSDCFFAVSSSSDVTVI